MVDIASLEESGLVLSMEAFSFTYEVEAMSKEGMGVIGRCGCVGEVDSRTEWVWGRGVMGSVCETDDGSADDGTDNGSTNGDSNNDCANNDATDYTSNSSANEYSNNTSNDAPHTNSNNNPSHNDSNGNANCSTPHI